MTLGFVCFSISAAILARGRERLQSSRPTRTVTLILEGTPLDFGTGQKQIVPTMYRNTKVVVKSENFQQT